MQAQYPMEFSGRVALVTGAASGIGRATCRRLHELGARVIGLDCDPAAAGNDIPWPLCTIDVTSPRAVELLVEELAMAHGPAEFLVHAAGILVEGNLLAQQYDWAQARRAYEVHVDGLLAVVRAVAPAMIRLRHGAIVVVASNAGRTPRVGLGSYCATKAASIMLARCLGLELAEFGVRCNVVSPGSTDTPMLERMLKGRSPDVLIRGDLGQFRLGIPLRRLAREDDIVDAVLFLLSSHARHITLENLRVDGGATL